MRFRITYRIFEFCLMLCVISFGSSCIKDEILENTTEVCPDIECEGCEPLPSGPYGVLDQFQMDSITYYSPLFNPNNNEEILFQTYENGSPVIYKFNLITQEKSLIFEGYATGISWGAEDWILFTRSDFHVWKIKSDGTELSQVTSNGSWFHPKWNLSGDKFITYQGYLPNEFYSTKIMDINGVIMDSLDIYAPKSDWNHPDGLFGFVDVNYIKIINPYSGELISNIETPFGNLSINWISESEVLITTVYGIFKYDIYSGLHSELKCSCTSSYYSGGSLNNNRTKILYNLIEKRRLNNTNIVISKGSLVLMNIDGTNAEIIEIPT